MAFYEKYRRERGEDHPHIKMRPNLTPHQLSIWKAYIEIARSRLTDQGYRPLNDEDVLRWCRRRHRSLRYADLLWWHVQRLDDVWLQLMGEKRERDAEFRAFMARN